MKLLYGTGNPAKISSMRKKLSGLDLEIIGFKDLDLEIPEIVEDGINGYLCDPHYWFFDENNIPNPKIWNNRRNTIYSGNKSDKIINFLVNAISKLNNNRDILEQMSLASFEKANKAPFDQTYIIDQWNELIIELQNK